MSEIVITRYYGVRSKDLVRLEVELGYSLLADNPMDTPTVHLVHQPFHVFETKLCHNINNLNFNCARNITIAHIEYDHTKA